MRLAAAVEEASALVAGVMPVALSDADVLEGADQLHALGQMAQAMAVALLREAETRGLVAAAVPWQTLKDGLHGVGTLFDGTTMTSATCRLMACDARVLPAVMDGDSLPPDLGRTPRLFTGAVRKALHLRDRGCAFPNCDRKGPWTEAHHCKPWYLGGCSDLWNGVLVFKRHHRLLHHSGWRVRINPLDGLPDFFAPGDDTARCNHYHRRP